MKLMGFEDRLNTIKEGSTITIRYANANVVIEHLHIEIDRCTKFKTSEKYSSISQNFS